MNNRTGMMQGPLLLPLSAPTLSADSNVLFAFWMRVLCVFVMLWQALLCMEPIYFIGWTTATQLISLVPARSEANSSIEDIVSNAKCQSNQI